MSQTQCIVRSTSACRAVPSEHSLVLNIRTSSLLSIPYEIRQMIYRAYIGTWKAVVAFDKEKDCFRVHGLPDTSLLRVCKTIRAECRTVYQRMFSGGLRLRDLRVHRKGQFGFQSSLEMVATLGIEGVLRRVHTVVIEDGTTGMLVLLPWYKFPALQRVELEDRLESNPFAVGRISKYWPFDATNDADGKCQICGVFGYDQWSCVPACVADGRVRVVSVRRGFAAGACLRTVVEHKAKCGEFVERVYEDDDGGWRWIMNGGGM